MIETLASHYNYYAAVILMGVGLYVLVDSPNLVKKVIGMNVFQTGIFLFFITAAFVEGAAPPVVAEGGGGGPFVSPLPHVLILTAIVVGVSLTAVALALVVRIYATYGTLDEEVLRQLYHD